jgi:alpha-glucosidase (family GH31 glycosyl hydrolase)
VWAQHGHGFSAENELQYNFFQEHMGDFTFSPHHFPTLRQAQDKVHCTALHCTALHCTGQVREAGLRLALTINPFVSVDSPSFREGVRALH